MFDESIEFLNSATQNLESGNLEEASKNISMMESYLPVGRYEGTNRLCSRYAEIFSSFCDEDHRVKGSEDDFKSKLIKVSKLLKMKMKGENTDNNSITTILNNLQDRLVYTGRIEKLEEDSALGDMMRSILENVDE